MGFLRIWIYLFFFRNIYINIFKKCVPIFVKVIIFTILKLNLILREFCNLSIYKFWAFKNTSKRYRTRTFRFLSNEVNYVKLEME